MTETRSIMRSGRLTAGLESLGECRALPAVEESGQASFGGMICRAGSVLAGLLLVALFWGGMIPLTKYQLQRWDPYFLVAVRSLAAAPFLWLLMLWTRPATGQQPAHVPAWRVWTFGVRRQWRLCSPLYSGRPVQRSSPGGDSHRNRPGGGGRYRPRLFSPAFQPPDGARPDCRAPPVALSHRSIPALGSGGITFGGGEVLILLSVVCWSLVFHGRPSIGARTGLGVRISFATMATSGARHDGSSIWCSPSPDQSTFPPAWPQAPIEGFSLLWYILTVDGPGRGAVECRCACRGRRDGLALHQPHAAGCDRHPGRCCRAQSPPLQQLVGGALVLLGDRLFRMAHPAARGSSRPWPTCGAPQI